jgi:Sigma-70 region 2
VSDHDVWNDFIVTSRFNSLKRIHRQHSRAWNPEYFLSSGISQHCKCYQTTPVKQCDRVTLLRKGRRSVSSNLVWKSAVGGSFPILPEEDSASFDAAFSRSRKLLYLIACRVLEGSEGAEEAIQNCFFRASRNTPVFEDEAAFRSWLFRVLFDEALLLRRRKALSSPVPINR